MSTSYLNFVVHKTYRKSRDKAEKLITLGRTCETCSFESSDFRRLCDFGLFRTNIAISQRSCLYANAYFTHVQILCTYKYKSFLRKSWALLLPLRYLFQGHSTVKRNKQKKYTLQLLVKNINDKRADYYVLLRNYNNDFVNHRALISSLDYVLYSLECLICSKSFSNHLYLVKNMLGQLFNILQANSRFFLNCQELIFRSDV